MVAPEEAPPPNVNTIPSPVAPASPLELVRSARINRGRMPVRFRQDVVPEGVAPIPVTDNIPEEIPPTPEACPTSATVVPNEPKVQRTEPNAFGLVREYYGELPVHDPDENVPFSELVVGGQVPSTVKTAEHRLNPFEKLNHDLDALDPAIYAPWPNPSSALLAQWHNRPSNVKSLAELTSLIDDVLLHPAFQPGDLRGVPFPSLLREMGSDRNGGAFNAPDGWRQVEVSISIPPWQRNSRPFNYNVPGLVYRPLIEVIRAVCESERAKRFHFTPYRLIWQPGQGAPEQIIQGEFYTTTAFIEAYNEIQLLPREPGCDLPRAMVSLFIASDSTHLAQFGTASLWPAYLMFGNESKYVRGRPSSCACHHVAYIPKVGKSNTVLGPSFDHNHQLPDDVNDAIRRQNGGKAVRPELITHCRRELMQACWKTMLDDEFIEAYTHGIVIICGDGIRRRLYPRIFTYISDYPEK
jgi:hypothetical protein